MAEKCTYAELEQKVRELSKELESFCQRETELKKSESYYRAFFEHGMEGIVILDPETARPIDFNDQVCRQLGYSRDEFAQLRLPDIEAVESAEEIQAHIQKIIENGFDNFETAQRTKHGEIRDVHVSAQMIDIDGRGVYHCIWRDITEHKRAEDTQRDSEQRFRAVFRGSPSALCITTLQNGIWVEANQAELDMFGYTREEVIGQSALNKNLWVDLTDRQRILDALTQGAEVRNQTVQLRCKDGRLIIASVSAAALTLKGEKHVLYVTEDITDRMHAEEMLKSALMEKEVLLREIHHRVKNNMQVISSLIYLQAMRAENVQARQALIESQQRINAMAMIHETIYGSQNLATIDFSCYLKSLVNHLQGVHGTRANIRIVLESGKVNLDINQAVPCSLILNELITNAFKHAFPNGRKGMVQIKVRQVHDRQIELEVSDNGVGLTPDQDLSNPSTLGLRLVHGLLKKQLKGSLDVSTGAGTAFTLRWPLSDSKGQSV